MKAHPPLLHRRVCRFGLTCMLACLAVSAPFAADLGQEIHVAKDRGGSELKVEITPDGARQTATPSASIAQPTIGRIREQIGQRTGMRQEDPPGKPFEAGGSPEGEITARDAKSLIKTLRDYIRGSGARAESPVTDPATVSGEKHATVDGDSASIPGRN
jgi:hypothetical protein